jgi:hypothetical protein
MRCASQQNRALDVRCGSVSTDSACADHVGFTSNTDHRRCWRSAIASELREGRNPPIITLVRGILGFRIIGCHKMEAVMNDAATLFADGAAYERRMERWSRLVGEIFLNWLAVPAGLRWLNVGCGNGAFTEVLIARCAPAAVSAKKGSRIASQAGRGKNAGRDWGFECRRDRTFATATENQRRSSYRQFGPSSEWSPI